LCPYFKFLKPAAGGGLGAATTEEIRVGGLGAAGRV